MFVETWLYVDFRRYRWTEYFYRPTGAEQESLQYLVTTDGAILHVTVKERLCIADAELDLLFYLLMLHVTSWLL